MTKLRDLQMDDRHQSGQTRDGKLVTTHPGDFSLGSMISKQRSGRVKASELAEKLEQIYLL